MLRYAQYHETREGNLSEQTKATPFAPSLAFEWEKEDVSRVNYQNIQNVLNRGHQ